MKTMFFLPAFSCSFFKTLLFFSQMMFAGTLLCSSEELKDIAEKFAARRPYNFSSVREKTRKFLEAEQKQGRAQPLKFEPGGYWQVDRYMMKQRFDRESQFYAVLQVLDFIERNQKHKSVARQRAALAQGKRQGTRHLQGRRRYDRLLLPGDDNRFAIKYSQTFYDPAVLERDLDGLSLIVLPVAIDISVKDSSGKMNERILLKKGETVEAALNPVFWEYDLPSNSVIKWEVGQVGYNGNFAWKSLESTGSKISFQISCAGIGLAQARLL